MSKNEVQKMVKEMKAYSKKISSSKEASKQFLVSAGILDSKGNLTEFYRQK